MRRQFYALFGLGKVTNKIWQEGVKDFRAFACDDVLYLKINLIEKLRLLMWAKKNGVDIIIRKPNFIK